MPKTNFTFRLDRSKEESRKNRDVIRIIFKHRYKKVPKRTAEPFPLLRSQGRLPAPVPLKQLEDPRTREEREMRSTKEWAAKVYSTSKKRSKPQLEKPNPRLKLPSTKSDWELVNRKFNPLKSSTANRPLIPEFGTKSNIDVDPIALVVGPPKKPVEFEPAVSLCIQVIKSQSIWCVFSLPLLLFRSRLAQFRFPMLDCHLKATCFAINIPGITLCCKMLLLPELERFST